MIQRAKWFENSMAYHLVESSLKSGRSNGLIRGSSIGSKCVRKLGYMVLGYEEQPQGAHSGYVLNFGNAFHDMVQGWMSRMGLVNATPYLDNDKHLQWQGDAEGNILDLHNGIIGHYDGLTQPLLPNEFSYVLNPEGKRYLLEFKTISNKPRCHAVFLENFGSADTPDLCTVKYLLPPGASLYSALEPLEGSPPKQLYSRGNERYAAIVEEGGLQSGDLIDVINKPGAWSELTRPKEEHICQATYYATKLEADAILIVYLCKDMGEDSYEEKSLWNLPVKAFELDVEDKIILKIGEKAAYLWECLEQGKASNPDNPESWLPPRPFSPDESFSDCKFCPFAYTCYPDHPKVIASIANKFEEQALALLPVATGLPFAKHDSNAWGKKAASLGHIKDDHITVSQVSQVSQTNVIN